MSEISPSRCRVCFCFVAVQKILTCFFVLSRVRVNSVQPTLIPFLVLVELLGLSVVVVSVLCQPCLELLKLFSGLHTKYIYIPHLCFIPELIVLILEQTCWTIGPWITTKKNRTEFEVLAQRKSDLLNLGPIGF